MIEYKKMCKERYIKINNRRYLGNKYKLLPFIKDVIEENCKNIKSVADIFSGTGAFASAFTDKIVITNDLLYSNYICNVAWFSSEKVDLKKIKSIILDYNNKAYKKENYMTKNFANTFFSFANCSKIGQIREDLDIKFKKNEINFREFSVLIMSLLYAMDHVANTCGHYDAYIRNADLNKDIILDIPLIDNNNIKNKCYNLDANILVTDKNIGFKADLVYIDPPYNSRQYSDAYHLLENVAKWEKPKVFGIAKKMDRCNIKSKYCTNEATETFKYLIDNLKAKYIILSYNNTGNKSNERSNARITDKDIMKILSSKGETQVFKQKYKAFTTGKSKNNNNEERIFVCEVG